VQDSSGLSVSALAVSSNGEKIIISGSYSTPLVTTKGIFELSLADGSVRTVVVDEDRGAITFSGWHDLSLSPDGTQALAGYDDHLELIDLVEGTARPYGGRSLAGAWSPDGKWIATLDSRDQDKYAISLIGAKDLLKRRNLGLTDGTKVVWSPDSRYLLAWNQGQCRYAPYYGTLEKINIETGRRSPVLDSTCKVNQPTFGWLAAEFAR